MAAVTHTRSRGTFYAKNTPVYSVAPVLAHVCVSYVLLLHKGVHYLLAEIHSNPFLSVLHTSAMWAGLGGHSSSLLHAV